VSREGYDRLGKETWGELQRRGPARPHQHEALIALALPHNKPQLMKRVCASVCQRGRSDRESN